MTLTAPLSNILTLWERLVDEMNPPQNKDDWVRAQKLKVHKPIDVDTLMWVRQRLMRFEVEMRWADRICVFEEFFPNDAITPQL
ncbi:hypothetical protein SynA1528_01507 [Synechococcus sp. A15-28]|nr:hypothetical protein SynA1528_01507 [Synechococcus sp. A15-28]